MRDVGGMSVRKSNVMTETKEGGARPRYAITRAEKGKKQILP